MYSLFPKKDFAFAIFRSTKGDTIEKTIDKGEVLWYTFRSDTKKDVTMQKYKLISSDLDCTLLSSDMTVSRENEAAIHTITQKGVHFVPNTGRTLCEIPESIKQSPDIRYIIYSNGAAIYDKECGTVEGTYLPRDIYLRMISMLKDYKAFIIVHTGGTSYVDAEQFNEECMCHHQLGKYYRDFLFQTNTPVKNFQSFCEGLEEVEMICTFFQDDEDCRHFTKRLNEAGGVSIVSSFAHNIEVLSAAAGKGNALVRLAERLGISREDTMSLGDSKNDLDMINAAGIGIAVKNAWPILRENADVVLDCTNDEHVVKYVLEKYFD